MCPYVWHFYVLSHCLLLKGGRGIGKTQTGGEMRSRSCMSTPLTVYFFLSGLTLSIVWVAIYSIWSTLLMFHTDIHTDATPTHAPTLAHTHIQMRPSLLSLPALRALGAACLPFTVTAVCVCECLCVCVDLRKEILRVKCSPGLSYHFWVLSHHPTSQGLAVFLSVSLSFYNTHTHTQEELQTVLAQWGVQSERREETGVTWPVGERTHTFSDWKISHAMVPFRHAALQDLSDLQLPHRVQVQLSDHWSLWTTNV